MDLRSFREDKLKIKSQSAFAELIGVDQSSISRWEKDSDSIPFQVIQRILEKTGASYEELAEADKKAFIELIVEVSGEKNGRKITYKANCPKMNAPGPELKRLYGTALVYVALPLAIGTMILGDTELRKGIIFSDELDPDDFLKRMMDTGYPYKWNEIMIGG